MLLVSAQAQGQLWDFKVMACGVTDVIPEVIAGNRETTAGHSKSMENKPK